MLQLESEGHLEAESWDQRVGWIGFFFVLNSVYLFFRSLYRICYNIAPVLCFYFFNFKFIYILNWRLISLQNCVGFCQTATWIIRICFYFLSLSCGILASLPGVEPTPPALDHQGSPRVGFFWSLSPQLAGLLTVSSYSLPSVHVSFPNFLFY